MLFYWNLETGNIYPENTTEDSTRALRLKVQSKWLLHGGKEKGRGEKGAAKIKTIPYTNLFLLSSQNTNFNSLFPVYSPLHFLVLNLHR